MPLPALSATPDPRTISERGNVLIRDYNREDKQIPLYALDTGSANAYVIAPVPGIEQYLVGRQIFGFKAANANTGASTLNVNGVGVGSITRIDGSALQAGDIPANGFVEVIVTATTPTFALLTPPALPTIPIANSGATTFLGGDVALNNTANFFNGPGTGSIGANGQTWLILATATVRDTAGSAVCAARIHDGTNGLAGYALVTGAANFEVSFNLQLAVVLSAATTFTLQARDSSSTSGQLLTTGSLSPANRATSITAVRLA